jgi:methylenetetrahydrofolate dehydrogenase (NADP+)/methenyltetrahydrofolate cyclohydrolase
MLLESKLEAPTVTTCHIATKDLLVHTRRAELLFVAVGKAGLVTADMVRPGACVIDIGINEVDGKVVGDVDFDGVKEVAGMLTPVPGGVGPVSVALFLQNVLACVEACRGL